MKLLEKSVSLAAASSVELYSFVVPPNATLTLRKLGNYTDAGGWTYITWRLRKNGIPVYPYENVKDQRGIGNTPADTEPIIFSGGDVLSVTAENSHGSTAFTAGLSIGYDLE